MVREEAASMQDRLIRRNRATMSDCSQFLAINGHLWPDLIVVGIPGTYDYILLSDKA